ncbi:hypothetical protein M1D52_02300 [Olivibacter sp. SA151]|uniref:hypothetical protein n=1 Tax=Olivibacter jilunii TaxID=985016 RepID=UPI003F15722A
MSNWFMQLNKRTVICTIGFLIITVLVLMFALRTKELNVDKQINQSYQEVDTVPMHLPRPLFDIDYDEVIFAPSYTWRDDFQKLDGYYWNLLMPERISLHAMGDGHVIALFVRNKWVFGFAKVPNQPIDFGALWNTNGFVGFIPFSKKEFEALYYKKVKGRGAIPVIKNHRDAKL